MIEINNFVNLIHNQPDCMSPHAATKWLTRRHMDSMLHCSLLLQFITFCKTATLLISLTPDSGTLNTVLSAFCSTTRNTSRKLAVPSANSFSSATEMCPASNRLIVLSRTSTPVIIQCWHSSVRTLARSDFPSEIQNKSPYDYWHFGYVTE